MKFSDYVGTTDTDIEDTIQFIKTWFHPEDQVLVSAIAAHGGTPRTMSMAVSAREIVQTWNSHTLKELGQYNGNLYGLYFGVSPLKDDHQVDVFSRGGMKDVKAVYGLWADLDVKPGSFESRESIYQYLSALALEPTLVLENGISGGVHAYWKLDKPEPAKTDILDMWWTYLESKTQGRAIDRLTDASRLMRLPGAVHYPKEFSPSGPVKLVKSTGAVYTRAQIEALTEETYKVYLERKAQTRAKAEHMQSDMPQKMLAALEAKDDTYPWNLRLAQAVIENKINDMSWADILEPVGWTLIGEGDYGEKRWARPGVTRKSAHTDWQGSEVMSLHSWSEDTGLADLKEAGIPLTKSTVLLRLHYGDNVEAMINSLR